MDQLGNKFVEISVDEQDERGESFLGEKLKQVMQLCQTKHLSHETLKHLLELLTSIDDHANKSQQLQVVGSRDLIRVESSTINGFDSFTPEELEAVNRRLLYLIKIAGSVDQADQEVSNQVVELASQIMAACCGETSRPAINVVVHYEIDLSTDSQVVDAENHGINAKLSVPMLLPCFASADVGYRIWGAAKVMCLWIMQHPLMVAGKTVLELGAGCGMCGFVAHGVGARSVLMTDFNQACLEAIRATTVNEYAEADGCESATTAIAASESATTTIANEEVVTDGPRIDCEYFDWTAKPPNHPDIKNTQVILGAAVVYEPLHAKLFPMSVVKAVSKSVSDRIDVFVTIHKEHSGFELFNTSFPEQFRDVPGFKLVCGDSDTHTFPQAVLVLEDGRCTYVQMYQITFVRTKSLN